MSLFSKKNIFFILSLTLLSNILYCHLPLSPYTAPYKSYRKGPKIPLQNLSSPQKVLFILPNFVYGGMGTAFFSLLKHLPDHDALIDTIVLNQSGIPFDPATLRPNTSLISKHKAFQKSYDTVISYAHWINPNIWIKTVNAKKKIQWIHCDPKAHPEWVATFARQMTKVKLKQQQIDAFICVSEAAKENFKECFPEQASQALVIYNIVDNEQVRTLSKSPQTDMPKEDDTLHIVTVARLSHEKGIDIAIQAHAQLEREGIHVKWYVIGDGDEKEALESAIQENGLQNKFILLGYKQNPYPYIKNADIFALFSREEGFGLVVTEAKILQKPIIITNFITAKEHIDSGKNGLIVNNDIASISQGLRQLIQDHSLRAQFSQVLTGYEFPNDITYEILKKTL